MQFIVCILHAADGPDEQSSLVFVDQHAADERVQLELLQRGCLQRVRDPAAGALGGAGGQIQSQPVAYEFDLRPNEAALLTHFRHKMRWFGLRFTVVGTTVKVTQAPRVLVGFGSSKVKVSGSPRFPARSS